MIAICVLNFLFCIASTHGNLIIVHAAWKESWILAKLQKLFLSLASLTSRWDWSFKQCSLLFMQWCGWKLRLWSFLSICNNRGHGLHKFCGRNIVLHDHRHRNGQISGFVSSSSISRACHSKYRLGDFMGNETAQQQWYGIDGVCSYRTFPPNCSVLSYLLSCAISSKSDTVSNLKWWGDRSRQSQEIGF